MEEFITILQETFKKEDEKIANKIKNNQKLNETEIWYLNTMQKYLEKEKQKIFK